jgi:hypothetical protein
VSVDPVVTSALVAGIVSLAGVVVSYVSNATATSRQLQQAQFNDVIAKRIELYPGLWHIIIRYETNWTLEGKPKTSDWAREYVSVLNDFNLSGGLFFSQALYERFDALRSALYRAMKDAQDGQVRDVQAREIHDIVYGYRAPDRSGQSIPGLSTHLKDDLGSYTRAALQKRV